MAGRRSGHSEADGRSLTSSASPHRSGEILVISSCTATKTRAVDDPQLVAAADLYAGDQHRLLMAGIREYRQVGEPAGPLRLRIVSAGHGFLDESERIRSYDVTFTGLRSGEVREQAVALRIPAAFADELKQPRALTILALGEAYLRACAVERVEDVSAPVLALTGGQAQHRLPASFIPVPLGVPETRRFKAGFIGLKGAVTTHLLQTLAERPTLVADPWEIAMTIRGG